MEQQTQEQTSAKTQTAKEAEQTEQAAAQTRARPRLAEAQQALRGVLAGIPMQELPRSRLETLAGLVGNSAMEALLTAQTPQPRLTDFRLSGEEPGTVPSPVPETSPSLVQPPSLTAASPMGTAFDPAGLTP